MNSSHAQWKTLPTTPALFSHPVIREMNFEVLGEFPIKAPGWGRWKHLPELSDDCTEYAYIVQDEDGMALYVGKTGNVRGRMQGHIKKTWWGEAKSVVVFAIHGRNKVDAEFLAWDFERIAIEQLAPRANIRPGVVPRKSRYDLDPYGGPSISELREGVR